MRGISKPRREGDYGAKKGRGPRILLVLSLFVLVLVLSFSVARAYAATTVNVAIGGSQSAVAYTKGVVWFNGYQPSTIVIHPGDTVFWTDIGGVHTVTSASTIANGSFLFDSSPLFTTQGALSDLGPGKLLPPGSVFNLDTKNLAPGTYSFICKIHPGMAGNLTITTGPVTVPVVNAVAGFGDSTFAQQAFLPNSLTVPQGTIISWKLLNPTEPHTITGFASGGAVAWDSSPDFKATGPPPVLLPNQHFSYTFTQAGTYNYFCKVHAYQVGSTWAGMVGAVLVESVTAADVLNTLTAVGYAALALAVIGIIIALIAMRSHK